MSGKTDDIRIMAEPQIDTDVCRFHVDRTVYDGVVNCTSAGMAHGSPLLEALFALPGIQEVLISGGTITIAKDSDDDWSVLGKKVGAVIRERIMAGGSLISPDIKATTPAGDELRAKVQDVFDKEINPGLATHGGSVELIDVQGATIFVSLSGGCQGCASAKYTLRHGIEQILRSAVPEVKEVVDVTDHVGGDKPYY